MVKNRKLGITMMRGYFSKVRKYDDLDGYVRYFQVKYLIEEFSPRGYML